MDKLKMEELPEPIGNFIIEQKDLYYLQLPDGRYWHYKDVVTMLSRFLKSRFNPTPSSAEVEKSLREQIDEAHIGLAHFLTDNVSTHIREGFNGWQAGFTVQQQTFYLQPVSADKGDEGDTEEKARWYQTCLETALSKIINNEYDVIDDMVSEQKRWLGELTPSGAEVYRKALEKIMDKAREVLPEKFSVDDPLLTAIYTIFHTARISLSHSAQPEPIKITVKFEGPFPVDSAPEWICYSDELKGMVCGGKTKEESWQGFIKSLKVKIAFDSGISSDELKQLDSSQPEEVKGEELDFDEVPVFSLKQVENLVLEFGNMVSAAKGKGFDMPNDSAEFVHEKYKIITSF